MMMASPMARRVAGARAGAELQRFLSLHSVVLHRHRVCRYRTRMSCNVMMYYH